MSFNSQNYTCILGNLEWDLPGLSALKRNIVYPPSGTWVVSLYTGLISFLGNKPASFLDCTSATLVDLPNCIIRNTLRVYNSFAMYILL